MIFDPLRGGGRLGGGGGLGPMGPFPPRCGRVRMCVCACACVCVLDKSLLTLSSSHPPGARFDPVSPFGPRHPPGRNPRGGGFYE